MTPQEKTLEAYIERGMQPGQQIRFPGEASATLGMEAGDLIVTLEEADEEEEEEGGAGGGPPQAKTHFVRLQNGVDLLLVRHLSLAEALLGYRFAFKHLDDRWVAVRSPPDAVTQHDSIRIVEGEGMPILRSPDLQQRGDLYIKFLVRMPSPADLAGPSLRADLARLLPTPAKPLPEEAAVLAATDTEFTTGRLLEEKELRRRQQANAKAQREGLAEMQARMHGDDWGDRVGGPQCASM